MVKTLQIPDDVNELTLGQYQKFLTVAEGIEGELLKQRTVEMFCNISYSTVAMMSHKDVSHISEVITHLVTNEPTFQHRFKIEGVEFGFIPDLENMTSGEFADLTNYMSDNQNLHKAMAVLFRPITLTIGEKYEIAEYNGSAEYAELMRFTPLGAALGASVFFCDLARDLSRAILHYTEVIHKETLQQSVNSLKGGGFIRTFTNLRRVMLEGLKKSLSSIFTNVSRSSRLKLRKVK